MQNSPLGALYSKKLNGAKINGTTMKIELLYMTIMFKESRSMLLGAKLTVHTDHKRLMLDNLQTHGVLRW